MLEGAAKLHILWTLKGPWTKATDNVVSLTRLMGIKVKS